ncbi:hypothetical protein I4U23_024900 [Adineta vaga]|nr:hypothetical protein I4U23_024900 [Adineta vaga]
MAEEIEEQENLSPVIRLFERLAFERGQEVHDQVSSMIELFSMSEVTLDMLDTLIECVKVIFVNQQTNKNQRLLDFLIILAHVTHLNYTSNKNLSLVFDALIDIFSQAMIAIDSHIRYTTFRILNKLQTFIDLSRSPYVPDQFEQYLLELLKNETTLLVLDEVIPLAAKFQHKNPQFIDAFLTRINSPKWNSYLDRRRQIVSLINYSPASLQFLLTSIEMDSDVSQLAFESLLADERGFTIDLIGDQGRLTIFKIASTSRDLSRLIFTKWIIQSGNELVDILRLCKVSTLNENKKNNERLMMIETSLKYFLADDNIRRIVSNNMKKVIGVNKGRLLSSNTSNYVENLFTWRILCQLTNEEEEEEEEGDDHDTNIHPDFHEFITYLYRIIKTSINEPLSATKEFILCQHASILLTFDMLDMYRRKCLEAMGRCILVHYGQYETIIQQAYQLIHRVHPSPDTINERYQLITYTLNDVIQRCKNVQAEKMIFIQCMTIARVFIEQEKQLELNNTDFKSLIDSLIKSGLSHNQVDSQSQTLSTLRSFMCHSQPVAIEYLTQLLHLIDKTDHVPLKCQSVSTFIDVLLVHGLDILKNIDLSNMTPFQFTTEYLSNLFDERNIEMKSLIVFGLMKLLLSSRCEPTSHLLKLILDYRFSNDNRSVNQQQRDEITAFFYFFTHLSISHVQLIEELTFDLVSRCLPCVSDNTTKAYQSVLTESMCSFCVELLSLRTLPIDEHPHYHLAVNLLESIHQSTNNRTTFIIKSYLNTIKHLQFQYMNKEQLQTLLDLIKRVRQYPNLLSIISNLIKSIEDQIESSLKLIHKLTGGCNNDKRPRSPSLSSPNNTKRTSSLFNPVVTSSPNVLQDRTNQMTANNDNNNNNNNNRSGLKGIKRKLNSQRYTTLDFENDPDDYF